MALREIHCQTHFESFDGSSLAIAALSCSEALDAGHRVNVEAFTNAPFEPSLLLGQTVSVIIALGEGAERAFHGYLFGAHVTTVKEDLYRVDLDIRSKLEILTLGRNSRIFQEKSVPDIVRAILDEAALSDLYTWNTSGTYAPRTYVVQYNESDYDFVKRLLADEGIGFALHNGPTAEELVFFDDSTSLTEIEGESTLIDSRTSLVDVDVVTEASDARRATSDAAMLRDYDFMNPGADLSVTAEGEGAAGREVYIHTGGYSDTGVGQTRVDRTLESLSQHERRLRGNSDCPRLEPGRWFNLIEHGHEGTDGSFLVVSVRHDAQFQSSSGRAVTYRNSFEAMPVDVPCRPPVSMERPFPNSGVQNAFVTGPSGSEIHSEEWGRTKVHFPWDRNGPTDDTSSTWLRVGQYPLGGSMIIPRVGFEVLVDFELGDIDRPAIAGHLYNGEAMPPYELPGAAVRSSFQTNTTDGGAGANELRFDDTAGAEEIFLNASYDYITTVANNATINVANDESYEVGSNRVLSVTSDCGRTIGAHETIEIGGNQTVTVGGSLSVGIGGSLTTTIGAMRKATVGGDLCEGTVGNMTRDVGALQSITGIAGCARQVVGNCTTTVSAAWLETIGDSRMVSVGGAFSEKVGALKLIKAKTVGVSAGAAYAMTAGAESVKTGGARNDEAKGAVAISAAGGMKVKAADIVFTADSKLVFKGGAITLELTSSGQVKIKAPTVKVKKADVLKQAIHKSA